MKKIIHTFFWASYIFFALALIFLGIFESDVELAGFFWAGVLGIFYCGIWKIFFVRKKPE